MIKMRKSIKLAACVFMTSVVLFGCASEDNGGDEAAARPISLVSREEGSGTRGAFTELFGVLEDDVDKTSTAAEITNSTSVMMTTVQGNENAIGYISLGSLNDTIKAMQIDGIDATAENVKNGTYTISRPFNIVTKGTLGAVGQDFVDFIMSADGQKIVQDEGYIAVEATGAFTSKMPKGKVEIAGSSSVTPVMEVLKEAYETINKDATIDIQMSDSSTGVTSVIEGVSEIGMASRELKDTETSAGVTATVIATDGVVVIVNKSNAISNMTKEQVKNVFTGEVADWSALE